MRRLARLTFRTLTQGMFGIAVEVAVLGILFAVAAVLTLVLTRVF